MLTDPLSTLADERTKAEAPDRERQRAALLHEAATFLEHMTPAELTDWTNAGRAIVARRPLRNTETNIMKTNDNDTAKTETKKPSECLPQHPHYEGDDRNFCNALEYEFAYRHLSLGIDNALADLIRSRDDLQVVLNIAIGLMCGWSGDPDDVYRDAYDAALSDPIEPGAWRKLKLAEERAEATIAIDHDVKDDFHPRTLVLSLLGAARCYVRANGPESDVHEEDREEARNESLTAIARACRLATKALLAGYTKEALGYARDLVDHHGRRDFAEYPDPAVSDAAAAVAEMIEALAGESSEKAAQ